LRVNMSHKMISLNSNNHKYEKFHELLADFRKMFAARVIFSPKNDDASA
jgi:hypothetical protein